MAPHLALRAHLDREGLAGGLRSLNERVPHRFTGVYRLVDGTMHNVGLVDKRGEIAPEALLAVPLTSSTLTRRRSRLSRFKNCS